MENNIKGKKSLLADLGLFLVALMWGGGFVVTKNTVDLMDPIYLNFLRFLIASVVMGGIFFRKLKDIKPRQVLYGSIMGFFLFMGFMGINIGIQYTTVSKQAFITASNVVMVPFIVWLIGRKKPEKLEVISAIFCFIGLVIISYEGDLAINKGDLLALMGALFFASHISSVGYFSKDYDPILLTIIQFITVALLSLIACFVFKSDMSSLSLEAKKGVLYMGVFSTLLGFGIQNLAQKYTSSTHAAIILSLESVVGAVLSVVILKEAITIRFILGCFIILLAVIVTETKLEFINIKNRVS